MIASFLNHSVEDNLLPNKSKIVSILQSIKNHNLTDSELIDIIANSLEQVHINSSKEVVAQYFTLNKGAIKVLPDAIMINGTKIEESDITPYLNSDTVISKKATTLKKMFERGNQKCKLAKCKNKKKLCYLKISIEEHNKDCFFCYNCLRCLALQYLNSYSSDNLDPLLWKCSCGLIIPNYYLQMALGDMLPVVNNIFSKTIRIYFCMECGDPVYEVTPQQEVITIKCEKHRLI